ncbi:MULTISPECIES: PhnD/SsuA/transferrin family substrate-binding protein [Psychrobacter]|uniref:PhnD/SsuA/transferrin family substrate-binding protein n=1 Tax=Psychrobacter communis TaxID=2762238 RepID=A0ABR8RH79_9GAMM|nr:MULTISPECIES: PhnD/SsuA/transferrin family substrate-binding protein [Psychrobacter]MBD7947060.1 PhnD/SsuA/transferrin family substrate-binding protein [Psychrobacter communis]WLW65842.1 PhnD/SsuA/transferrin family substrate-binding protein [Psychrobacter sp. van23A]HCR87730.1 phosphate ABC transporter substrate-binding protein [Psychrobacter sp.]
MTTHNMLIAPDFSPERFAGWHMFNTLIQKRANLNMHLNIPTSHAEQETVISEGDIQVIYANPFDAATLIREHGYHAVARPIGKSDEMVIAAAANSDINSLDDIKAGATIAMADNHDVKLIGLRLLEAVDIEDNDLNWSVTETYQAAARQVIKGDAQAAFFLAEIFHSFSRLTKAQLSVLIESDLADISHVLLIKDGFPDTDILMDAILNLHNDDDGKEALTELGMPQGFEAMNEEDAEFMIDLMQTLLD